MAFDENLSVFLSADEFSVPVVAGTVSGQGILDMPSEIIADGVVLTTDYKVMCEASKFGSLVHGDEITVNAIDYTVRNVSLIDDGAFCEIMMQKT